MNKFCHIWYTVREWFSYSVSILHCFLPQGLYKNFTKDMKAALMIS